MVLWHEEQPYYKLRLRYVSKVEIGPIAMHAIQNSTFLNHSKECKENYLYSINSSSNQIWHLKQTCR